MPCTGPHRVHRTPFVHMILTRWPDSSLVRVPSHRTATARGRAHWRRETARDARPRVAPDNTLLSLRAPTVAAGTRSFTAGGAAPLSAGRARPGREYTVTLYSAGQLAGSPAASSRGLPGRLPCACAAHAHALTGSRLARPGSSRKIGAKSASDSEKLSPRSISGSGSKSASVASEARPDS